MPKHVLFICQRPPYPPNKGEKLRTYYQLEHLKQQGVKISVACPLENSEAEADLNCLVKHLNVDVIGEKKSRSKFIQALALVKNKSVSEEVFFSSKLNNRIEGYCRLNPVDAIIYTASSLINYAKTIEADKYMDFMDLDSDKWLQYAEASGFPLRWVYAREAKYIKDLEQQAISNCKECYLISDNEISLLQATLKSRAGSIIKIGNGISPQEFYPPEQRRESIIDDVRLLFVGVMDYKPNEEAVSWFCEHVWPQVKARYRSATFSIVGMNPSNAVLKLANLPGVTVTGKVDSVLPYFHKADLFVAPFHLARGVQNKVLQSFACALPVLTTPMGFEGIEGNVLSAGVSLNTPKEFISAIEELISNNEKRQQMAENAVALIEEKYSWHSALADFLKPVLS